MLDLNEIHHGCCLELMRDIPDGSVDLVVCDPPYRMTKRGKSCRPNWMPDSMGENVFIGKIPNVADWMAELYRVMATGHVYVFTNTISLQETLNAATEAGFKLHNIISMIKDTGMPNRWYYKQTELVLFFRKGAAIPINDPTSRDNIKVKMPTLSNGKVHITQKPLSFIEKLIKNSTSKGDTVLDPFMGSGTTAIAALNTGRQFIGIEQEEKYVAIGRARVTALQPQLQFI